MRMRIAGSHHLAAVFEYLDVIYKRMAAEIEILPCPFINDILDSPTSIVRASGCGPAKSTQRGKYRAHAPPPAGRRRRACLRAHRAEAPRNRYRKRKRLCNQDLQRHRRACYAGKDSTSDHKRAWFRGSPTRLGPATAASSGAATR